MSGLGAGSEKKPWPSRMKSPEQRATDDAAQHSAARCVAAGEEAGEVGASQAEQGEHNIDGLRDTEREAGDDAEQHRYGNGEDGQDGGRTGVQQRGHVAHRDTCVSSCGGW